MIILYGGSFNPPTIAHYELSGFLIKEYNPKTFIFIPVGDKYNKSNLISFKHRLAMTTILAEKLGNSIVSDFEGSIEFKGTIGTLNYYQKQYPNDLLFYVIGADNLLSISSWINYQELLEKYHFLVLNRHDIDIENFIKINPELNKYQKSFLIVDNAPKLEISATMYRDFNQDNVVLTEVNEYIYRHQLYNRGVISEK